MNIDYYAFVMDNYKQEDYSEMSARHHAHIFENFDFDMAVARDLGKLAIFCKETGKFYNSDWEDLDLNDQVVMPRCTIPELSNLMDQLEDSGSILATTKEDYKKIMDWPNLVRPKHHEVVATTYGEFLENFQSYKEKFGRVFFKTKYKNISTEVKNIMCLGAMSFSSILSDEDLFSGKKQDEDLKEMSKPMYMVFTADYGDHNDLRFGYLSDDTEVYVEPYLNICKDWRFKKVPVEYRSFVVDGKFNTARSWVPDKHVPKEVINVTQEVVDSMPDDMNKTFVVDILEFKDKSGKHLYDLCEINPLPCSGYERGNSIFVLEDHNKKQYPKADSISDHER